MAIILACAFPDQACDDARDILERLGVERAVPSDRHAYGPEDITHKMCVANHIGENRRTAFRQYAPGTTWKVIGADLFLANADQPDWGWCSKNTLYFLDFWKDFDPQVNILFLYSSPERALAQLIQAGEISAERVRLEADAWRNYYVEALRFYQNNQDRCLLVDVDAVLNDFDAFRSMAGERLKIDAKDLAERVAIPYEGAILELIVSAFADELGEAQELYAELESVADMPSVEAGVAPKARAAAAWNELAALANGPGTLTTLGLGGSANERLKVANETIELLQAQLEQTQEELQYYFLKASEPVEVPAAAPTKNGHAITAVRPAAEVDLTSFVDGTNWYHAEQDGRWAGPERISTIRLPKIAGGDYILEIDVVAAMADDIINGVQVRCGSTPVKVAKVVRSDIEGVGALLRRARATLQNHNSYPLKLKGRIALPGGEESHVLSLDCPRTISPASMGESDTRDLSVRVKSVRLIPA